MNNVVFKDGETIGLTIEQVLTIHLGESEIFDTPTFRIDLILFLPIYENTFIFK